MKFSLTIIFLSFFLLAKAQQVDETKSFLDYIRIKVFNVDTLFYTEGLNEYTLPEVRKYLIKDTIWIFKQLDSGRLQRIDSIILSKEEKTYIEKQLIEQEGKIWGKNLLEKSQLTENDTTYKQLNFSEWPRDYNPKTIYSFSKPIFLRRASICFFYYQSVSADRSKGQLGLYKKDNSKWKFVQWFYFWSEHKVLIP